MTGSSRRSEMTADDVCDFLDLMNARGVRAWLDGGWAVDACLGSQTRSHGDLDIVLEERDMPVVVAALKEHGYALVPRDDSRAWNFVMGDDTGIRWTSTSSCWTSKGAVCTDRRRTESSIRPRPWPEPEASTDAPWPASRLSGWSGSTLASK
jgi:hypothetical protein